MYLSLVIILLTVRLLDIVSYVSLVIILLTVMLDIVSYLSLVIILFNSWAVRYRQLCVISYYSVNSYDVRYCQLCVIIQWIPFLEVNTRVDQFLFSPKLKVINCFII